jgi:hypothetical protein
MIIRYYTRPGLSVSLPDTPLRYGCSFRRAPEIHQIWRFFSVLDIFLKYPLNRYHAGRQRGLIANPRTPQTTVFLMAGDQERKSQTERIEMTTPVNLFISMKK